VHSIAFFSRLGFFFRPGFLDPGTCRRLLEQSGGAAPAPARVFDAGPGAVLNVTARKAWNIPLDDIDELSRPIGALGVELAAHFQIPLRGHEGPTLLRYEPGGFYEPHVDRAGDDEAIAPSARRVSVVIFLNTMSTEPRPGDYTGGALTFYGVVGEPEWRQFGFALQPLPGLLVAFPSHLVHEVTPVIAGDRYTIVDWFTA
jgi:predicted 2-oxoglutarate/Fe(II)-dependent dioxygenase YbiX